MKKKLINVFITSLLAAFIFSFSSCSNSLNAEFSKFVRISLASPYNDKVEAKVYIEGEDGNIINGALVSIKDSSNTVNILEYNFQQGCYYKLIEKPSNGQYIVTINSRLLSSPAVFTISHTYLESSIDYKAIEMVNKIGQNFQNYDSFDTEYPIRVTWPSTEDDCTYKITVRTPLEILYETSTNNKTIEIPAETIPAGTAYVYLQIQQQKSYGDVNFEKANYYSVSVYTTGNINFNVQ